MHFPVLISKEPGSDYGVMVPDLPGCITAGTTVDEALAFAREAIELHLEGMVAEGMPLPKPSRLESLLRKKTPPEAAWALVTVDFSPPKQRVRRVNVTIPELVLDAIDLHARTIGETRSGTIVKAAMKMIGSPASAAGRSRKKSPRRSAAKGRGK